MIDFSLLDMNRAEIAAKFRSAMPFNHVVIDNFCDDVELRALVRSLPDPVNSGVNKSRDYIFAKNKFEQSEFEGISPQCAQLKSDLLSERFQEFLSDITEQAIFVDPNFHGGGVHQGGAGSFLDMHVDFNSHPEKLNWFRNLNILIYLNEGWESEWGGELDLKHRISNESVKVEPIFNRCVIMFTRDYTLHGYEAIKFPRGEFRKSIAAYAYTLVDAGEVSHRSTVWYPTGGNSLKRQVGRWWPLLVGLKNRFLGSGTSNNR